MKIVAFLFVIAQCIAGFSHGYTIAGTAQLEACNDSVEIPLPSALYILKA